MVLDSNEKSVNNDSLLIIESYADTAFVNSAAVGAYYFERAMDYYKANDLRPAREYFSKAKVAKSPVLFQADLMHKLLNKLDRKSRIAEHSSTTGDSTAAELVGLSNEQKVAADLYEVGRVYETLQRNDSALYYYHLALDQAPKDDPETGKYYLTYSERIRETDPYIADSLLEVLVEDYTYTEYGAEAMKKLNFVVSLAIDTAAELYESGYKLYKYENYRFAVSQSEYAKSITYTVDLKSVMDTGGEIPDSLKAQKVEAYKRSKKVFEEPKLDPNLNPVKSDTPADLSPKDFLKDPKSSKFNKAKDLIKSPLDEFKKLKDKTNQVIDDPNAALKSMNPIKQLDSLKLKTEPLPDKKKEEGGSEETKEEEKKEEKKETNTEGTKEEENGEGK
jgi:tetratricopeptide (TPR) repeat protein